MTYQGKTKGLAIGSFTPEAQAKELYIRTENYAAAQRKKQQTADRDKVFAQNAPKNPIRNFFYNMEKRRLAK